MQPIRIFSGSFKGETIYQNGSFVSPNIIRAKEKLAQGSHFTQRVQQKKRNVERKKTATNLPENKVDSLFKGVYGQK